MQTYTSTYSPEDNKLRLYATQWLDDDVYAMIREQGFRWAPKQELFVAPTWTPGREDMLTELCGGIGDEDTSVSERAEDRAERFEGYQANRARDAETARAAVAEVADNIPLGQPILVGHHSEKHARRDQQRIENGMRRAVKMWRTSEYWERRADGVISSASYKATAPVRARRIKKLQAAERKSSKERQLCQDFIVLWEKVKGEKARERALFVANFDHVHGIFLEKDFPRPDGVHVYEGTMSLWSALDKRICTPSQARQLAIVANSRTVSWCERWAEHYALRIKYETAILKAQGSLHLLDKPKRAKLPPILNYRQAEFQVENQFNTGEFYVIEQAEMTKAQLRKISSEYKGTRKQDGHRIRVATQRQVAHVLGNPLPKANTWGDMAVFLTDSKVHDKPETAGEKPPETERASMACAPYVAPERTVYDDLADTLKNGGVQTVVADQLFITPPELAARAVELAEIRFIHSVLEPSAGTGNLVLATRKDIDVSSLTAVEINRQLCDKLESLQPMQGFARWQTVCQDFLTCGAELGKFDRIVMNPPFKRGADILHVKHAARFLKPGGRLVSFCANGSKQRKELKPLASEWYDLPDGSFKASRTNVNAALFVIEV